MKYAAIAFALLAMLSLAGTVAAARAASAERSGLRYLELGILGILLGLVTLGAAALGWFLWNFSMAFAF